MMEKDRKPDAGAFWAGEKTLNTAATTPIELLRVGPFPEPRAFDLTVGTLLDQLTNFRHFALFIVRVGQGRFTETLTIGDGAEGVASARVRLTGTGVQVLAVAIPFVPAVDYRIFAELAPTTTAPLKPGCGMGRDTDVAQAAVNTFLLGSASKGQRTAFGVYNNAAVDLFIRYGLVATVGEGIRIPPNTVWWDDSSSYQGPIFGIWTAVGGGAASITDLQAAR